MAVLFCSICGHPSPSVGDARAHVTKANGSHEGRDGSDPGVIVDTSGDPVEPPEQREQRSKGRAERRTTERRAAIAGYINDRGGSSHVVDHGEQAERFGVAISTISDDLIALRESGEIEEIAGPCECGYCGELYESIRAAKVHVTKRSDDAHRDRDGTDPGAIRRPTEEVNHA